GGRWNAWCASPTRPVRSSRPGWSARPRCRPRPRSSTFSATTRSLPRRSGPAMDDFDRLRELRAVRPSAIVEAAAARVRRPLLGPDGRLMLVAADHPARGALGVRTVPDAMADRYGLLRRLVTALGRPGVDGVLGSPDVLEDLLLLGALDGKVAIGSMNR